jgi:hypothetical protein
LPDAPPAIATGSMQVLNNTLCVTAGAVNANWEGINNKNGVFTFSNNAWSYFNSTTYPAFDSLPDLISVAIDPVNESIWAGSFGGGLVNIKNNNTANLPVICFGDFNARPGTAEMSIIKDGSGLNMVDADKPGTLVFEIDHIREIIHQRLHQVALAAQCFLHMFALGDVMCH